MPHCILNTLCLIQPWNAVKVRLFIYTLMIEYHGAVYQIVVGPQTDLCIPFTSNSPGHLMGKKSIESLPGLQGSNHDSDYLTPSETAAGVTERLMEALMQQKNLKQTTPQSADRLLRLHSAWREEDRDKYLREVSLWIISASVIFQMFGNKMSWLHVFLHYRCQTCFF